MTTTPVRAVLRVGWLAAGVALLGFAVLEVTKHDLGPLPIVAFAILPDLAFLVGLGAPHAHGQLPSRAVPVYNALHQPVLPLALVAIGALGLLPLFWFVAGLTWLAHVALDRAFGYGLRTADGWQRG